MSFAGVAIVALRESLEALLVCGILAGIVVKLGYPAARRSIVLGGLFGVVVSVIVGIATHKLARDLYDRHGPAFEAAASLLAVAILTYMIVWMYRHTQATLGTLHQKAKDAVLSGRSAVLIGLAFVVVVREGLETVVFVAAQAGQTTVGGIVLGLVVGIALSVVVALLLFRGIVHLSLEKFFAVTGVLLILVAGGLLGYATHEGEEVGWFPETPQAWDTSSWLPHKCPEDGPISAKCAAGSFLHGMMGYRATPAWLDLGVWLLYVGAMTAWYLRPLVSKAKAGPSA